MRKNKSKPIKARTKFAIIGDGKCESWYIQMLKRNERAINVDLEPKIPQRKKLSDQFNKIVELSNDYDKVFWIVDFDVINSEARSAKKGRKTTEFKEYYDKIRRINQKVKEDRIIVIINNPCLEYWFLLHFEPISKFFNTCDEATTQLKKHLPDYEKTQAYYTKQNNDIYIRLKPKLATAIANASNLGEFDFQKPYAGMTQMQLFFETEQIKVGIEAKENG